MGSSTGQQTSRDVSTSNFHPSKCKEVTACVILTNGQRNESSSVSKCACLAAGDVVHTVGGWAVLLRFYMLKFAVY